MTCRHVPLDRMRRLLMASSFFSFAAAALKQPAAAAPVGQLSRTEALALLHRTTRWGCQYQNIDIEAVAASDLDMVVLEPSLDDYTLRFITPSEIERLKRKPDGSRRLVLGYLPVGEADINRWYWPQSFRDQPPSWQGPPNLNWPGAHPVRYWHPDWRDIVALGERSLLKQILEAGYDGALLDRVDAYWDWRESSASAQADMVELVATIATQARSRHAGFLLVPQNAEDLLSRQPYLRLIDGLNKESLLTGLRGKNAPNTEDDVSWSLQRLQKAQESGIKIFATEYVDDTRLQAMLQQRLEGYGFTPFFGIRELDRLPA